MNISWTFRTHHGSFLSVQFHDFKLEQIYDHVYIISGDEVIGNYNGFVRPPITISTTNAVTIFFSTDNDDVRKGFQAEIRVYHEDKADGLCANFNDGYSGWSHHSSYRWQRSSEQYFDYDDLGNRYKESDDFYIYVESDGNYEYGVLDSPPIPDNWNEACLRFNYYMSGDYQQCIRVYKNQSSLVFNIDDDYSRSWKSANVTFSNDNSYVRLFGRSLSNGYNEAMVAVDDVYISEGACSDVSAISTPTPTTLSPMTWPVTTPELTKTEVVCSGSFMTVYVDASAVGNNGTAHFIDETCGAAGYVYRNGMQWLYLYTKYNQCKTTMTSTLTSTSYHNQVIVSTRGSSTIYRREDRRITVECELENKGQSSVNFDPVGTEKDYFKHEHDNFTFSMRLYTDDSYSTTYRYYPVTLDLGSRVYVGASVETFSNDMVLFADSCKATPNPDPHANPQHKLIENSCSVDSTVDFDGQSFSRDSSQLFFSFETFGFNGDYSTVFVHCQLSICNSTDWRCYRNCNQRQRRDVNIPDKLSDSISIELGPVLLKTPDDDLGVNLDSKESIQNEVFPFSATLLFAVSLVVLAVGCVLWVTGWIKNKHSYQKVELEDI